MPLPVLRTSFLQDRHEAEITAEYFGGEVAFMGLVQIKCDCISLNNNVRKSKNTPQAEG